MKKISFATMITVIRIILTPYIVAAILWQQWNTAFVLCFIAMMTDMLDGYIARTFNQQTFLGACLDPIADKILLISCFVALAIVHVPLCIIPWWFVWMILIKELLLVIGVVSLMLIYKQNFIRPTLLGKMAAAMQMLFIAVVCIGCFLHWMPTKLYMMMFGFLFCLVVASLIQYIIIGIRVILRR